MTDPVVDLLTVSVDRLGADNSLGTAANGEKPGGVDRRGVVRGRKSSSRSRSGAGEEFVSDDGPEGCKVVSSYP